MTDSFDWTKPYSGEDAYRLNPSVLPRSTLAEYEGVVAPGSDETAYGGSDFGGGAFDITMHGMPAYNHDQLDFPGRATSLGEFYGPRNDVYGVQSPIPALNTDNPIVPGPGTRLNDDRLYRRDIDGTLRLTPPSMVPVPDSGPTRFIGDPEWQSGRLPSFDGDLPASYTALPNSERKAFGNSILARSYRLSKITGADGSPVLLDIPMNFIMGDTALSALAYKYSNGGDPAPFFNALSDGKSDSLLSDDDYTILAAAVKRLTDKRLAGNKYSNTDSSSVRNDIATIIYYENVARLDIARDPDHKGVSFNDKACWLKHVRGSSAMKLSSDDWKTVTYCLSDGLMGAGEIALRTFGNEALPSLAKGVGIFLGAKAGGAATAAATLNPVAILGGTILGGALGGAGAGYLGRKAQDSVLEKYIGKDNLDMSRARLQDASVENPLASKAGSIPASALEMLPSIGASSKVFGSATAFNPAVASFTSKHPILTRSIGSAVDFGAMGAADAADAKASGADASIFGAWLRGATGGFALGAVNGASSVAFRKLPLKTQGRLERFLTPTVRWTWGVTGHAVNDATVLTLTHAAYDWAFLGKEFNLDNLGEEILTFSIYNAFFGMPSLYRGVVGDREAVSRERYEVYRENALRAKISDGYSFINRKPGSSVVWNGNGNPFDAGIRSAKLDAQADAQRKAESGLYGPRAIERELQGPEVLDYEHWMEAVKYSQRVAEYRRLRQAKDVDTIRSLGERADATIKRFLGGVKILRTSLDDAPQEVVDWASENHVIRPEDYPDGLYIGKTNTIWLPEGSVGPSSLMLDAHETFHAIWNTCTPEMRSQLRSAIRSIIQTPEGKAAFNRLKLERLDLKTYDELFSEFGSQLYSKSVMKYIGQERDIGVSERFFRSVGNAFGSIKRLLGAGGIDEHVFDGRAPEEVMSTLLDLQLHSGLALENGELHSEASLASAKPRSREELDAEISRMEDVLRGKDGGPRDLRAFLKRLENLRSLRDSMDSSLPSDASRGNVSGTPTENNNGFDSSIGETSSARPGLDGSEISRARPESAGGPVDGSRPGAFGEQPNVSGVREDGTSPRGGARPDDAGRASGAPHAEPPLDDARSSASSVPPGDVGGSKAVLSFPWSGLNIEQTPASHNFREYSSLPCRFPVRSDADSGAPVLSVEDTPSVTLAKTLRIQRLANGSGYSIGSSVSDGRLDLPVRNGVLYWLDPSVKLFGNGENANSVDAYNLEGKNRYGFQSIFRTIFSKSNAPRIFATANPYVMRLVREELKKPFADGTKFFPVFRFTDADGHTLVFYARGNKPMDVITFNDDGLNKAFGTSGATPFLDVGKLLRDTSPLMSPADGERGPFGNPENANKLISTFFSELSTCSSPEDVRLVLERAVNSFINMRTGVSDPSGHPFAALPAQSVFTYGLGPSASRVLGDSNGSPSAGYVRVVNSINEQTLKRRELSSRIKSLSNRRKEFQIDQSALEREIAFMEEYAKSQLGTDFNQADFDKEFSAKRRLIDKIKARSHEISLEIQDLEKQLSSVDESLVLANERKSAYVKAYNNSAFGRRIGRLSPDSFNLRSAIRKHVGNMLLRDFGSLDNIRHIDWTPRSLPCIVLDGGVPLSSDYRQQPLESGKSYLVAHIVPDRATKSDRRFEFPQLCAIPAGKYDRLRASVVRKANGKEAVSVVNPDNGSAFGERKSGLTAEFDSEGNPFVSGEEYLVIPAEEGEFFRASVGNFHLIRASTHRPVSADAFLRSFVGPARSFYERVRDSVNPFGPTQTTLVRKAEVCCYYWRSRLVDFLDSPGDHSLVSACRFLNIDPRLGIVKVDDETGPYIDYGAVFNTAPDYTSRGDPIVVRGGDAKLFSDSDNRVPSRPLHAFINKTFEMLLASGIAKQLGYRDAILENAHPELNGAILPDVGPTAGLHSKIEQVRLTKAQHEQGAGVVNDDSVRLAILEALGDYHLLNRGFDQEPPNSMLRDESLVPVGSVFRPNDGNLVNAARRPSSFADDGSSPEYSYGDRRDASDGAELNPDLVELDNVKDSKSFADELQHDYESISGFDNREETSREMEQAIADEVENAQERDPDGALTDDTSSDFWSNFTDERPDNDGRDSYAVETPERDLLVSQSARAAYIASRNFMGAAKTLGVSPSDASHILSKCPSLAGAFRSLETFAQHSRLVPRNETAISRKVHEAVSPDTPVDERMVNLFGLIPSLKSLNLNLFGKPFSKMSESDCGRYVFLSALARRFGLINPATYIDSLMANINFVDREHVSEEQPFKHLPDGLKLTLEEQLSLVDLILDTHSKWARPNKKDDGSGVVSPQEREYLNFKIFGIAAKLNPEILAESERIFSFVRPYLESRSFEDDSNFRNVNRRLSEAKVKFKSAVSAHKNALKKFQRSKSSKSRDEAHSAKEARETAERDLKSVEDEFKAIGDPRFSEKLISYTADGFENALTLLGGKVSSIVSAGISRSTHDQESTKNSLFRVRVVAAPEHPAATRFYPPRKRIAAKYDAAVRAVNDALANLGAASNASGFSLEELNDALTSDVQNPEFYSFHNIGKYIPRNLSFSEFVRLLRARHPDFADTAANVRSLFNAYSAYESSVTRLSSASDAYFGDIFRKSNLMLINGGRGRVSLLAGTEVNPEGLLGRQLSRENSYTHWLNDRDVFPGIRSVFSNLRKALASNGSDIDSLSDAFFSNESECAPFIPVVDKFLNELHPSLRNDFLHLLLSRSSCALASSRALGGDSSRFGDLFFSQFCDCVREFADNCQAGHNELLFSNGGLLDGYDSRSDKDGDFRTVALAQEAQILKAAHDLANGLSVELSKARNGSLAGEPVSDPASYNHRENVQFRHLRDVVNLVRDSVSKNPAPDTLRTPVQPLSESAKDNFFASHGNLIGAIDYADAVAVISLAMRECKDAGIPFDDFLTYSRNFYRRSLLGEAPNADSFIRNEALVSNESLTSDPGTVKRFSDLLTSLALARAKVDSLTSTIDAPLPRRSIESVERHAAQDADALEVYKNTIRRHGAEYGSISLSGSSSDLSDADKAALWDAASAIISLNKWDYSDFEDFYLRKILPSIDVPDDVRDEADLYRAARSIAELDYVRSRYSSVIDNVMTKPSKAFVPVSASEYRNFTADFALVDALRSAVKSLSSISAHSKPVVGKQRDVVSRALSDIVNDMDPSLPLKLFAILDEGFASARMPNRLLALLRERGVDLPDGTHPLLFAENAESASSFAVDFVTRLQNDLFRRLVHDFDYPLARDLLLKSESELNRNIGLDAIALCLPTAISTRDLDHSNHDGGIPVGRVVPRYEDGVRVGEDIVDPGFQPDQAVMEAEENPSSSMLSFPLDLRHSAGFATASYVFVNAKASRPKQRMLALHEGNHVLIAFILDQAPGVLRLSPDMEEDVLGHLSRLVGSSFSASANSYYGVRLGNVFGDTPLRSVDMLAGGKFDKGAFDSLVNRLRNVRGKKSEEIAKAILPYLRHCFSRHLDLVTSVNVKGIRHWTPKSFDPKAGDSDTKTIDGEVGNNLSVGESLNENLSPDKILPLSGELVGSLRSVVSRSLSEPGDLGRKAEVGALGNALLLWQSVFSGNEALVTSASVMLNERPNKAGVYHPDSMQNFGTQINYALELAHAKFSDFNFHCEDVFTDALRRLRGSHDSSPFSDNLFVRSMRRESIPLLKTDGARIDVSPDRLCLLLYFAASVTNRLSALRKGVSGVDDIVNALRSGTFKSDRFGELGFDVDSFADACKSKLPKNYLTFIADLHDGFFSAESTKTALAVVKETVDTPFDYDGSKDKSRNNDKWPDSEKLVFSESHFTSEALRDFAKSGESGILEFFHRHFLDTSRIAAFGRVRRNLLAVLDPSKFVHPEKIRDPDGRSVFLNVGRSDPNADYNVKGALHSAYGEAAGEKIYSYLRNCVKAMTTPRESDYSARFFERFVGLASAAEIATPKQFVTQATAAPAILACCPRGASVSLATLRGLNMRDAIAWAKKMCETNPSFRARYEGQFDQISSLFARSRRLGVGSTLGSVTDYLLKFSHWGDNLSWFIGGYGVYRACLDMGMSPKNAQFYTWLAINTSAQASSAAQRSLFELGPFGIVFGTYLQQNRQISDKMWVHFARLAQAVRHGDAGTSLHHSSRAAEVFASSVLFNFSKQTLPSFTYYIVSCIVGDDEGKKIARKRIMESLKFVGVDSLQDAFGHDPMINFSLGILNAIFTHRSWKTGDIIFVSSLLEDIGRGAYRLANEGKIDVVFDLLNLHRLPGTWLKCLIAGRDIYARSLTERLFVGSGWTPRSVTQGMYDKPPEVRMNKNYNKARGSSAFIKGK